MHVSLTFTPLDNKYTRWYFSIVNNRKEHPYNGYTEDHHVHPESFGGRNTKANIVKLSAREHYVCHLLLTKMLTGESKRRMHFAFYALRRINNNVNCYQPSSYIYELACKKIDIVHTKESKKKMSEAGKRRAPATIEHRANLSRGAKASYTPELRAQRSIVSSKRVVSQETRKRQSKKRENWAHMNDETREVARAKLISRIRKSPTRCKTWTLISPLGRLFKTNRMPAFCKELNLSYTTLRNKAQTKDARPVSRGSSKGWAVWSCH